MFMVALPLCTVSIFERENCCNGGMWWSSSHSRVGPGNYTAICLTSRGLSMDDHELGLINVNPQVPILDLCSNVIQMSIDGVYELQRILAC